MHKFACLILLLFAARLKKPCLGPSLRNIVLGVVTSSSHAEFKIDSRSKIAESKNEGHLEGWFEVMG